MKYRSWIIASLFIGILCGNESFFGVQTHFGQIYRGDMDSAAVIQQLELCREAGIQMIRDECLWSDVETDSGVYSIPPEIDHYVQSAKSRGINIYLILNYNNVLYAPAAGSGVTTEKNRIAYARYCQEIVRHFTPMGITHYEIWNEPNHGVLFWTPQPDPNDYFALLQTAYDSIKAVDSSVTVIGCATSPAIGNGLPFIEGLDFIRDVFAAGGGDYMDAVSFHLYQVAYRPEYEIQSYVNSVKSYVGDKPIYFSEFGYPTHDGWPNISYDKQANYITRMFLQCLLDPQIKSAIYYDLKNDGTVADQPEHHFGLLEFNQTPKPAYYAMKTLATRVNTSRPVSSMIENEHFIVSFHDSLTVAWCYSGSQTILCKVISPFTRILDKTGNIIAYHITANDSILLEVDESPRYIIPLSSEPAVQHFSFDHKTFLLYPEESIKCSYNAITLGNTPIIIKPNAISWTYSGNGGQLINDTFIADSPGSGIIIADIQGHKDTICVTVIDNPGYYTAETFSDTAGFHLQSTYLNMDASYLRTEGTGAWDAISLHYEYSESSAVAYLYKDILINHHADSIFLDIKTDEKEYDFRIYCKDANGKSYTLSMRPRPTTWLNTWGTLGGPVGIDAAAESPIYIEKIYIKMKPGETAQTAPYTGEIYLDNLRIKRGDAVGIASDLIVPSDIYLSQSYPNPVNGNCHISYHLVEQTQIRIDILNINGQIVATPLHAFNPAGEYHLNFQLNHLPSGIYIYRLSTPRATVSKKLLYIK